MRNLTLLRIERTSISFIPNILNSLNLTGLYLDENKIKNIAATAIFPGLNNLIKLELSTKGMDEFPNTFGNAQHDVVIGAYYIPPTQYEITRDRNHY